MQSVNYEGCIVSYGGSVWKAGMERNGEVSIVNLIDGSIVTVPTFSVKLLWSPLDGARSFRESGFAVSVVPVSSLANMISASFRNTGQDRAQDSEVSTSLPIISIATQYPNSHTQLSPFDYITIVAIDPNYSEPKTTPTDPNKA